jgi:hypothetical protein
MRFKLLAAARGNTNVDTAENRVRITTANPVRKTKICNNGFMEMIINQHVELFEPTDEILPIRDEQCFDISLSIID